MSINSTYLSTDPGILLPTSGERAITVIYLYNSDAATVTVDLYAVPSGTSDLTASGLAGFQFYGSLSIEPGDTFIVDSEKMLLSDGDSIYGSASTADVVVATVSYATL